eukprot:466240-Karenia_brevis.AAC.1
MDQQDRDKDRLNLTVANPREMLGRGFSAGELEGWQGHRVRICYKDMRFTADRCTALEMSSNSTVGRLFQFASFGGFGDAMLVAHGGRMLRKSPGITIRQA